MYANYLLSVCKIKVKEKTRRKVVKYYSLPIPLAISLYQAHEHHFRRTVFNGTQGVITFAKWGRRPSSVVPLRKNFTCYIWGDCCSSLRRINSHFYIFGKTINIFFLILVLQKNIVCKVMALSKAIFTYFWWILYYTILYQTFHFRIEIRTSMRPSATSGRGAAASVPVYGFTTWLSE